MMTLNFSISPPDMIGHDDSTFTLAVAKDTSLGMSGDSDFGVNLRECKSYLWGNLGKLTWSISS